LLGIWGYPAYFLLFLAGAVGSPLNEDLLLLLGGYLIGVRIFTWPLALPVAWCGIVASDSLLYLFGRKLRTHSLRRGPIRNFIRPGRLRVATRWFGRFGEPIVLLSRLVPGTRLIVFVSAGVRGMAYWRFVAYDGLAALLWAPLILALGSSLGERLGGVERALKWMSGRVVYVILGVAAVVVLRELWFAWAQRRTAADDSF
jgi:membrane protein DedA with SNARE-associated domain